MMLLCLLNSPEWNLRWSPIHIRQYIIIMIVCLKRFAESLEYAVVENILDGRPMEGITCPELLEYSLRLLDATLDYLPGASGSGGVPGQ